MTDAPPDDWGDYVALDDLNDLPECRATATADPDGLLRFEVTAAYAQDLHDQLQMRLDEHTGAELVSVVFPLDFEAHASLTKGLAQLLSAHQDGHLAAKQVRPEPTEGDIAVSIAVNASQMESSVKKNYKALKKHGRGRRYGHRFGISEAGAEMLVQQLDAAIDGADDPLEQIDNGGSERAGGER